jgi:hypothetical protein
VEQTDGAATDPLAPELCAPSLTRALAAAFMRIALANVGREYPHKLDHVLDGPDDLCCPRALHPLFYGSYDWHSCVHMHWLVVRLLRMFPDLPERDGAIRALDARITATAVAGELAYLERPGASTFERPYGWAWLLALDAELRRFSRETDLDEPQVWVWALAPLADAVAARMRDYLHKAAWPIRAGTHANSAFALDLALDHAEARGDESFATLVRDTTVAWYRDDVDCPVRYEPSAEDFLSPGLMEAALMLRVLPERERDHWLARFLPDWTEDGIGRWLEPAVVPDRSDARLVHVDGLNLSRAWCWGRIARTLPVEDERRAMAEHAASRHLEASLDQATGSDYVAEHWLATFAVLALSPS